MKSPAFILLFFCLSINGMGQNLVLNYSFENYAACPSGGGQLYLATPWMAVPANDVEYFNSCSTDTLYSVPYQGVYNFQLARTGNSYSGIFTYNGSYREYAQVQLTSSLQVNECYYVEFFVNRASGAAGGKYANNNIGCAFTNSAITSTGTDYVLNLPHMVGFGNPIVSDTLNWTKISGIFVASGVENFLTIGNFSDDANTDTLNMLDGTYPAAYYFIDDVSVIPIYSIIGGMPANAGNDTSVMIGDSVFVGQEVSNLNCNWYIGTTLIADSISGIYVHPTSNTFYVVEQNLCGTITYDTVKVNVSGVGVNEIDWSKKINIYPNPSNGEFKIDLSTNNKSSVDIEITDIAGVLVYSQNLQLNNEMSNFKLDISNGVYFVHITNTNTYEAIIKKLIIQK